MGCAIPGRAADPLVVRPRPVRGLLFLFCALMALQALGFLRLGNGYEGRLASILIQTLESVVAAVCAWNACRRARGNAQIFWFLFSLSAACWVLANAAFACSDYARVSFPPYSIFAMLYRFYALPVVILLLLPRNLESRIETADVLDFLQIAILTLVLYLGFFYLPARTMPPRDAEFFNLVGFTNTQNLLLIAATLVRYRLTPSSAFRDLLKRLLFFLGSYTLVASVGNDLTLFAGARTAAGFDLVWSAFYLFIAALAATWIPAEVAGNSEKAARSGRSLAHNAILAVLVMSIILLANTVGGTYHRAGDAIVIVSVVIYAVRLSLTESRQQRISEALRRSEQQYRYMFGKSPQPMWVFDAQTLRFLDVNEAAIRSYGFSRQEFLEMTLLDVRPPEEGPALLNRVKIALDNNVCPQGVWKHRKKDGTTMEVEITASRIAFDSRQAVLTLVHDVTTQRLLEEQLRQAQKMEAVGLLAGGIAHDFNNLLNVILGYLQLIPDHPGDADTLNRYTTKALEATRRAATLVRQLLAFGRKQVLWPRVLNLNSVLGEMGKILPRVLGENIDIAIESGPDLNRVKVDESQIEQVILNIAVNARDAMPDGGKLTIATHNHTVRADDPAALTIPSGQYVSLAISDTGAGMDAQTLSHIFEPFFTTKAKGKGTGLGLSIVYGIVKQSEGFLQVASAPGKGSTFEIFFPQVNEAPRSLETGSKEQAAPDTDKLNGAILLVEDEEALRDATLEYLKHIGGHVLAAGNGLEALALLQQSGDAVKVVVTDVVMPKMGGAELARRVRDLYPDIKIIFVSGYNDEMVARVGTLDSSSTFLPKPYTFRDLTRKIREAMSPTHRTDRAKTVATVTAH